MAIEYPTKREILNNCSIDFDSGIVLSKFTGRRIGYLDKDGYEVVNVMKREFRSHKLIMIASGADVAGCEVDHINGVRNDNRIVNIRVVSKKENAKNKRLRSNNKTGLHGVSWIPTLGKWRARINMGNKQSKSLGCFFSFLDAVCARKSAEIEFGYHINHGRVSK